MPSSPDQPVQLSISIVVYNSCLDLLGRTLASLTGALARARSDGRIDRSVIYLVDNASADAYRRDLEGYLANFDPGEGVKLVFLPQDGNLGFGHGHNRVLDALDSDYHLVLNPDAELAPHALEAGLCRLAADKSIVLLSPRFVGSAGEQEFLCKAYPSVLVLLLRGFAPALLRRLFRRRLERYELRELCGRPVTCDVEIASGCFMLLRTRALRAAGGFNEDFFLYFEDFDLSLRLAGQGRLVFEPAMEVVHHGGYAARKGPGHVKLFVRSGIRFFNLHGWRWI